MNEPENNKPDKPEQTQFLLTQLVLLTIVIIGLVLLVFAYPKLRLPFRARALVTVPTLRSTATASLIPTITLTPTPTRTLRYTLTPTLTLTIGPSPTPTQTPTPPGPPTITPARPLPNDKAYSLKTWTPEDADTAIRLMEDFPNSLTQTARGNDNSGYFSAFSYAVVALKEALLRFPEAPQAEDWMWRLAYNQARTGDAQAGEIFSELLTQAMNRGETNLDTLRYWFSAKEPRLELYDIEMNPPSGYTDSSLIQIKGQGDAFLLLVEKSGVFEVYPLEVNFDFVNPSGSRALLSDLTGDGQEEVVIFHDDNQENFSFAAPRVFDLSKLPASELPYEIDPDQPELGIAFENRWSIQPNAEGGNDLVFIGQGFPTCPVSMQISYRWNGAAFERIDAVLDISPDAATAPYCRILVDYSAENWGPETAAAVIEKLLPFWPPAKDETGKELSAVESANSTDELRFRLGVYSALAEDEEKARQVLNDLIANPSSATSQWVAPAIQFLELYENPKGLYRACQSTAICDPGKALLRLSSSFPPEANPNPIQPLTDLGVSLVASGYIDLDQDGITERWITIKHRPYEKPDLWIVAQTPSGPRLVNIGPVDESQPSWEIIDQDGAAPIIQLDLQNRFVFMRRPDDQMPFIVWLDPAQPPPNRFLLELDQIERSLFNGDNPAEVQAKLENLAKFPGLLCRPTWSCDRYYYLLGLASELAGDERSAVEAFLYLWRNYFRSPFTVLARLKLEGLAISLTTPGTPTLTPTIVTTATIGPSPTPTLPSAYPYPYPYPYPYYYPSP